jgi:cation transport ATPase
METELTQEYLVEGMTCGGCEATVEAAAKKLANVVYAKADHEKGELRLEVSGDVDEADLARVIPPKYPFKGRKANEGDEPIPQAVPEMAALEPSKLVQLKPLLIILFYLFSASILMHIQDWSWSGFMLDFMGLFYIVFAFFKMLDLKGFPSSFAMYDPIAKRLPLYGQVYPFIETALGLMFLFRYQIDLALIATIVILGATTYGVARTLLDKRGIRCACLGTVLKLPMTEATLIENAIMLIMAVAMLTSVLGA